MVSVKIHKPSISFMKSNKKIKKEEIIHNIILLKYNRFEYSYSALSIKNLIFNEQCQIVARFKDFLILDDMTEFLRRYYSKKDLIKNLIKICNFYESYIKIFPNYLILSENKYLYRNLRKKQKMIEEFNQIKKEEEENKNILKKDLNKKEKIVIFNNSIQESINKYQPSTSFLFNSIISGFKNKYNYNNDSESNLNSLKSISLNKPFPFNNKKYSNKNSFEFDNDEISLNCQNSLMNIVQILNKKYDNINLKSIYNKNIDFKEKINNNKRENNGIINIDNNIIKKLKNKNKIEINNKKKAILKNVNQKQSINSREKQNSISTLQKLTSSKGHYKIIKYHNHQKNSLSNSKKLNSHKQGISISDNNNNNNTIKIINNINNIIINDGNINKEMIINLNSKFFELNNTNLNTINNINDNYNKYFHKNFKNTIKKVKFNNINKSKETSTINKRDNNYLIKKLNSKYQIQNNINNNTIEGKKAFIYNNHILNFFNYTNNDIINNNLTNINDNTSNNIKTNKKQIQNNDIKIINKISEYKSLNINNIENNGNLYNNKKNNNYNFNIKDKNKRVITIDVDQYANIESKKRKKLDNLITENKKSLSKYKTQLQNKKIFETLNTERKIKHTINKNNFSNNYASTEYNNNMNSINNNSTNDLYMSKSNKIKSKLYKTKLAKKQKTISLQINKKNKNFFSSFYINKLKKEINSIKIKSLINNDNFMNEYIKKSTQDNLDLGKIKTKRILNLNENKKLSDNKLKKISAKIIKQEYHKFIQNNKIHGSYDTSNRSYLIKKYNSLYNTYRTNMNNTIEISQRKMKDKQTPFKVNNIGSTPGTKISIKNERINLNNNILRNYHKNNDKLSYQKKMKIDKKEDIQNNNKFYSTIKNLKNKNFIIDTNNKKMRFVKNK